MNNLIQKNVATIQISFAIILLFCSTYLSINTINEKQLLYDDSLKQFISIYSIIQKIEAQELSEDTDDYLTSEVIEDTEIEEFNDDLESESLDQVGNDADIGLPNIIETPFNDELESESSDQIDNNAIECLSNVTIAQSTNNNCSNDITNPDITNDDFTIPPPPIEEPATTTNIDDDFIDPMDEQPIEPIPDPLVTEIPPSEPDVDTNPDSMTTTDSSGGNTETPVDPTLPPPPIVDNGPGGIPIEQPNTDGDVCTQTATLVDQTSQNALIQSNINNKCSTPIIHVETPGGLNPQLIKKNDPEHFLTITIKTYSLTSGQPIPPLTKLEPLPFAKLEVKTCTYKGGAHDGHIHDKGTNDPCFKSNRPHSSLAWICCEDSGGTFPQPSGNPINVITDSKGIAKISYNPPSSTDKENRYYIAGKDQIIVTLTSDPSIKNDQENTITKFDGLEQMFSSDNSNSCISPSQGMAFKGTFFFERQSNHGCMFYGTPPTNDAVLKIANNFVQKQIECRDSPNNQCTIKDDKDKQKTITIKEEPKPIKITAMNLPWGGLLDIGDNGCKTCKFWNPPHKSHYSGKEVDIGFGNLMTNGKYDMDLIYLLRYVSSEDKNFGSFVSYEGRNIEQTMKQDGPHIHINFKN